MIKLQIQDAAAEQAAREILSALPVSSFPDCTFRCRPIEHGLTLSRSGETGEIGYGDRRSLLRAITLIAEHANESRYEIAETPSYELLCAMPDVSRNAVPTVQTLKKLYRLLAMEGYNAVMLYTEDVYELPNHPYFGHLRGRYTEQELKELDAYAELLGLEMIPAIQTLAHLNAFFEWPASAPLCDCNDIMLVGEQKVEALLDEMLSVLSNTLKSRKINIGFDEAFMLGCGKYLDRNGYRPRVDIMLSHLSKVVALCKKYGYEPRMWSDMFFRTANKGPYRVPGINISPEVAAQVPPEVTLVYWDYYQIDAADYDEMFRQHRAFDNPIAFAGGDSSWYGPVPLNRLSANCCRAAVESLRRNHIREVYVTMWKDDGAACSLFSTLPTLFGYAEACWGRPCEASAERLLLLTGMNEEEVLAFEDMYALPGREGFGRTRANPGKYMFYENILEGKFDCHIPDGSRAVIGRATERLARYSDAPSEYQYLFDTVLAFGRVLTQKAELGKELYRCYGAGDRAGVERLAEQLPTLCSLIREFREKLRRQWLTENKCFGFDVLDIRIGGLLAQLDTAQLLLAQWLDGTRDRLEELEAPRLAYGFPGDKGYDSGILFVNRWERIAGQNISNMF